MMADFQGVDLRIEDPGPPITPVQLEAFERVIKSVLPASLRELLLQYNGGYPRPNTFEVREHEERLFDIQVFYGISRLVESSNLEWNYREFSDIFGKDRMAFACTDTDDQLLLDLNDGTIWFWDFAEADPERRLYHIANSHRDFLSALRDEG
jgi:SMI1 / KNR4 family (SUKH-1)